MMAGLLAPDLSKNRGELYGSFIHTAIPYNAAKETVILGTAGGAPLVITLPPAANQPGKIYAIKKVDAGVGPVAITPTAPDLIDGGGVFNLAAQYDAAIVVGEPAGWWVISQI